MNADHKSQVRPLPARAWRGLAALLLAASVEGRAATAPPAVATPGPDSIWFQHVTRPTPLTEAQIRVLAEEIWQSLQAGTPPPRIAAPDATELLPRLVFLSCGTDTAPAAIHLGAGRGVTAAAHAALRQALAAPNRGPAPRYMKLDVVQNAVPIGGFLVREGSMPSPSLMGIAFPPSAPFAFLPEQLVAGSLVAPQGTLVIHSIAQALIKAERWQDLGIWTALSSTATEQTVAFFETQSAFFDGTELIPLFRGHRPAARPTAARILEAARHAGERLAAWCTEDGRFAPELAEWVTAPSGQVSLRDQAGAVLALTELHTVTGAPALLDAARRGAAYLRRAIRFQGADRRTLCVVEGRFSEAQPTVIHGYRTALDTNAMTALALLELGAATGAKAADQAAVGIGRFLLQQLQPGDVFINERRFPDAQILAGPALTPSALAVTALIRLYEETAWSGFRDGAEAGLRALYETYLARREMENLPRDEWLIRALDLTSTYARNDDWRRQVDRLSLAMAADVSMDPYFPDFVGSVNEHPSATLAARRSLGLTYASRLLLDAGRDQAANTLLQAAESHIVHQLQAQIGDAEAMYLTEPSRYRHAFRDHVLGFGLALHCEYIQILSLVTVWKQLQQLENPEFPDNPRLEQALAKAHEQTLRFPRFLPQRGALPAAAPRAAQDRDTAPAE